MNRIMTGLLILHLIGPALQADKGKASTLAEQYQALVAEYQAALKESEDALRRAKTQEERDTILREPKPNNIVPRFIELAKNNPKDPAAVDALIWVFNHTSPFDTAKNGLRARTMDTLLREYLDSQKLPDSFRQMTNAIDKATEAFLRTSLEKSPHREVQGQACLALVRYLRGRASSMKRAMNNPELLRSYETMLGKEYVEEVLRRDPKTTDQAIEQLFDRIVEKYADIKEAPERPQEITTLGDIARRELFSIRDLAVGKPVPNIEGEDLDGKKFKLSDYSGKVMLLDFWGYW
jgi:hypothetical protein